jgi:tRNA modification GTPase
VGILLDQLHGAFENAVTRILATPNLAGLSELAAFAPVGRHLVDPWKVVVAGAPNVGKSSLVNALAGYQRAVVSEVAGTTRDAVSVQLAFDGWPVELADTAGLRHATGLEAEGIERARRVLAEADLVVWVLDGTALEPTWPDPAHDWPKARNLRFVVNKCDLPQAGWVLTEAADIPGVSATTGAGIPELVSTIVTRLVPHPPPPGAAVPYTPHLADAVEAANAVLTSGNVGEAARLLRDCLPPR